ncbi:D1B1-LIKE PROTEIN REQUIRED FOR MITOSIS ENTRY [Encephalitozoon cuniculi GB-M1]|uniref:Spliceosomal protein DIB1 n=2 Tax=Encephalitozoon cuniculi TaxID=6035 RepID=Q8SSE0_ENCCU|nr:U4/U6-U5 snRNP complex subunit DIB1 [Encephalitozoon cuniculi GB-M1]AGE95625.1 d1b1-like protein required for mitosis entry [Encephalitozoon cuniculi]KMV66645.1 mitosis protein DIM1 [Encephalitozoon cuniculi EcunIII-L]UYI28320.1 mitosis protein [Encephalitozoon cuniculi]CAD25156.1 D1B1-LIKE PROTEIN REQUIRED FOR MITOSIS ENTRY [Encephalitozoon cuniculi GB-M1]
MINTLESLDAVNGAVGGTSCKLVVVRFGDRGDPLCIHMDGLLERICLALSNYVEIYVCERSSVRELVDPMGLDSPVNIMCFFNRRHIKIDCSSGDNDKINFFIENEEMLIELFTLAYKAGVKGKGIVRSPFKLRELQGEI